MQSIGSKFLLIFIIFGTHFIYLKSEEKRTDLISAPSINDSVTTPISIIDSVLSFSKQHIGLPYRGGGKGPSSFDCSGFTSFVFSNFGIKLGSSSADQAEQLPTISKNDIAPGDLVFFNGHRRGNRVGHVGLVVSKHENGEFDFIHSASSVGISISNSESGYYNRRFVKAGRVFIADSLKTKLYSNKQRISTEPKNNTKSEVFGNVKTVETTVDSMIHAKFHIVKKGETLFSISKKWGVKVKDIIKINNLKSEVIMAGQQIKLKNDIAQEPKSIENQNHDSLELSTLKVKNYGTHIVSKGETLQSISKLYGLTITELKDLNKLSADNILAGQKLKAPINSNKTTKSISAKQKTKTHTVKSGETLSEIAEKYNCTVRELKSWNDKSNNKLSIGEKLKIVI